MIVVADSGSTKTHWEFIGQHQPVLSYTTQGISPFFLSTEQIQQLVEKDLLSQLPQGMAQQVLTVYYYGTGCSTPTKVASVQNALKAVFTQADCVVDHDLIGAARALCGRVPGIACILGTGSNSCSYDGQSITSNVPSLGYFFGDEGSGAYIGKTFLYRLLKEQLPLAIVQSFAQEVGFSREDILTQMYQKPLPNRFLASFCPFIHKHLHHPVLADLVEGCFQDFIDQQLKAYPNYLNYPIHAVGSVAYYFQEQWFKVLSINGLIPGKVIGSPIASLVAFHREID